MSDTTADTTAAPGATAPAESVESLWVKAYQGEILGEALFARMAEKFDDPGHRHKMQVLATLERRTKEACIPALQRAGISTDPDPNTVRDADALADALDSVSWDEFMVSFEPVLTEFLALYARIGELDPSERETADLLVAHELALGEFARAEVAGADHSAGDSDNSLAPINALPHMQ
jgi:hypothetical protein